MRIALWDLYPHVTGMTAYSKHAAAGLKRAGLCGDVITFTKSGKLPERWASPTAEKHGSTATLVPIDRCEKWSDAVTVLKQYDGVVLNEPRNTTLDNAALKEFEEPPYMEALRLSRTPWACCMGCPQYSEDFAPYLADLVRETNCAGLMAMAFSFIPPAFNGKRALLNYWYPFDRHEPRFTTLPRRRALSIMGRLAGNKGGWTSLFAVLSDLPTDWDYEIAGSCGRGAGPATTIQMYESLQAMYGVKKLKWLGGEGEAFTPFRTDPFELKLGTGHTVRYLGAYLKPPCYEEDAAAVCLNLSSASFTTGTLEYVGLEALDRGTTLVTGPHLLAGRVDAYDVLVAHENYENGSMRKSGFVMSGKNHESCKTHLVNAIREAMNRVGTERAVEAAHMNWRTLETQHDPVKHARLYERLFSGEPGTIVGSPEMQDVILHEESSWNPRI